MTSVIPILQLIIPIRPRVVSDLQYAQWNMMRMRDRSFTTGGRLIPFSNHRILTTSCLSLANVKYQVASRYRNNIKNDTALPIFNSNALGRNYS